MEVPPLPFAAEVRAARERLGRSTEARLLSVQVEVGLRQLQALADLPALPDGMELPGAEAVETLVVRLGVRPDDPSSLAGRIAFFETAAAVLAEDIAAHDARREALEQALGRQQQAMYALESDATIRVLKALGAERSAVADRIGPLRRRVDHLRPLSAVLGRALASQVRTERAVVEVRSALEAFGEEPPDGEELAAWLVSETARLEAELAVVEARASEIDGQILALTG